MGRNIRSLCCNRNGIESSQCGVDEKSEHKRHHKEKGWEGVVYVSTARAGSHENLPCAAGGRGTLVREDDARASEPKLPEAAKKASRGNVHSATHFRDLIYAPNVRKFPNFRN